MKHLDTSTLHDRFTAIALSALLAGVTALCYWPSLRYLFVYDDYGYIVANFRLARGLNLDTLKWAFTTFEQANWHPLTWIVYLLEYPFFRLNPTGYHATNIILHAANVILFFYVLKALSGSPVRSFFASLVFCVHPTHIESVVWISELKDVLSCFFWMIATLFYIAYARKKSFLDYIGVIVSMILGLLAKPMLVTLPFAFLLLDAWPLGRLRVAGAVSPPFWNTCARLFRPSQSTLYALLKEKIPFFILVAASSIMTYVAQKSGGAVASLDWLPFWQRIANAIISYVLYLYHFVWPASLAFHYPHPGHWPLWQCLACAAGLIAITAGAVASRRVAPYLLFGWLWYLGTLTPVIGLIQVGTQSMADRYLYIPSAGLSIALVWGFADIIKKIYHGKLILITLGCTAIFTLMMAHVSYLKYWRDEIVLYTHGIEVAGPHFKALYNLGYLYMLLGDFNKSEQYFLQALTLYPKSSNLHNNLGLIHGHNHDFENAEKEFNIAMQLDPKSSSTYMNFANLEMERHNYPKAISYLKTALQLDPESPAIYSNLGFAYFSADDNEQALKNYNISLELYPNYGISLYRIGLLELKLLNFDNALRYFDETLAIDQNFYQAWNGKGSAYLGLHQYEKARESFEQALKINMNYTTAANNLISTYKLLGRKL